MQRFVIFFRRAAEACGRHRRNRGQRTAVRARCRVGGGRLGAVHDGQAGRLRAAQRPAVARVARRSISPPWRSIRFRLALRTYAPWGVRVVSRTKSRKIPTRNILPLFFCCRHTKHVPPSDPCYLQGQLRCTVVIDQGVDWVAAGYEPKWCHDSCANGVDWHSQCAKEGGAKDSNTVCSCSCTGKRREPFDSTPTGFNSISFGSPHVRPMVVRVVPGRLTKSRKMPNPKDITAL